MKLSYWVQRLKIVMCNVMKNMYFFRNLSVKTKAVLRWPGDAQSGRGT